MTLNDLADAIEALHVRASWAEAEKINHRARVAREKALRDAQAAARGKR